MGAIKCLGQGTGRGREGSRSVQDPKSWEEGEMRRDSPEQRESFTPGQSAELSENARRGSTQKGQCWEKGHCAIVHGATSRTLLLGQCF